MVEIIAILTLTLICGALLVERYLFAQKMLKQLNDTIKAIKSKNIDEYMAAISVDEIKKQPFLEKDEVFLDEASDEEFNKFVKTQ